MNDHFEIARLTRESLASEPMLSRIKKSTAGPPPVVWAIDAFSKDFETHLRTALAIRAHSPESQIHPVYVLSEDVFSNRGYSNFLRAALKPRAHHNLIAVLNHELLKPIRASGSLHVPRVLVEATANASACTRKLLRYAKRVGAEVVAIGSHGRSRLSRWFAGSFAETLLNESTLPLLITGPEHKIDSAEKPGALVMPTRLLASERAAFEHFLKLASVRDIPVHLVCPSDHPIDEWLKAGTHLLGGGWVSVEALFFNQRDLADEAVQWREIADRAGVRVQIASDSGPEVDLTADSWAESIVDYARKLSSPVIALSSTDGRALPSGLTRDLIRSSPFPLYYARGEIV